MVRGTHIIAFAVVMTLIGFAGLPAAAQTGRAFYIDYDSGSNSNPGTKASPWKTHPFMQADPGCTDGGNAPAYTHNAGDQFIFKGGVSWPAACFEMNITAGGVSGNSDYYGVDQTWYTGSSWMHPKFDLNFSVPTGRHVILLSPPLVGYVTFDNIEILHQNCQLNGQDMDDAFNASSIAGSLPGVLLENMYIHDWVTTSSVASLTTWPYSAGAIDDGHDRITVDHSTVTDQAGYLYNGGTKINGGFGGTCVNCGTVSNSEFAYGFGACFSVRSCHDNNFHDISQVDADYCSCRPHTQVVEDDYGAIIGMKVYNNLIHDNPQAGVVVFVNYSAIIYNNVMWNNSHGNIDVTEPGALHIGNGYTGWVYNNTVDCSNGTTCFTLNTNTATGAGNLYVDNNVWITNGTALSIGNHVTGYAYGGHSYAMSTSEANTYGFVKATKYAPTSSDSHVTSAGANLSSDCSADLADLCQDAQGAAWFGGSYQTRPLDSGAWTMGAYVFGGQSAQSSKPNPPTNLTAIVQ